MKLNLFLLLLTTLAAVALASPSPNKTIADDSQAVQAVIRSTRLQFPELWKEKGVKNIILNIGDGTLWLVKQSPIERNYFIVPDPSDGRAIQYNGVGQRLTLETFTGEPNQQFQFEDKLTTNVPLAIKSGLNPEMYATTEGLGVRYIVARPNSRKQWRLLPLE